MLERYGHGAATLSVRSECIEIVLFGGKIVYMDQN